MLSVERVVDFLRGRAIPIAIILAVFYCDGAMILHQSDIRAKPPIPGPVARMFQMFSVFSSYSTEHHAFEARALVRSADDDPADAQWRDFPLYDYFPVPYGDSYRRISSMTKQSPQRMIEQLKRMHHERHPDEVIERMALYRIRWPKGYQSFHEFHEVRKRSLIAEQ